MSDDFDVKRVAWVMDEAALERLIVLIEACKEVSWDLETTGLDEFRSGSVKITLASFTLDSGDTWLLPLYHPESPNMGRWREMLRRVLRVLLRRKTFLIAHNGKFDCRWSYRHTEVDLSDNPCWDTRLSSHLLDENQSTKLKEVVPRTFEGVDRWDDFDLNYDDASLDVPLIDLGLYAARDTYWTWRLSQAHRERMFQVESDEPPMDPEEVEDARLGRLSRHVVMPCSGTLTAIEQRGFLLDVPWVEDQIAADKRIRDETRIALAERYGRNPENASFAPTSHWFRDWAEDAVKAGDLRIAAMTKGGNPQWSKEVIGKQAREGSEVAQWLNDHRKAVKRLEYLHSWLDFCQASTGAVHTSYNVGSLVTGRLSSSGPNMQQVTKPLRRAFKPRPRKVVIDFDYSQIELRVAAQIAQCVPMIEAFVRGDDLHRLIAADITRKPPEDVTPEERQGGKAGNFGFLFGQTPYGFKFYAENTYGVVFDDRGAQRVYDSFFSTWDGMMEWHQRTLARAHRNGQVSSPLGRVRRLPGIWSSNDGAVKHAENAALNAPVQGMASDIMQIAAASIEGVMPGHEKVQGFDLLATVHDSIVGEADEDRWEEIAEVVIDRMTNAVLPILAKMDVDFQVPLVAEATAGTRWGLSDIGEIA